MEIIRRFVAQQRTPYAAYTALQIALMRHFVARGGTAEEFCERLAPVFHRRFGFLLTGRGLDPPPSTEGGGPAAWLRVAV